MASGRKPSYSTASARMSGLKGPRLNIISGYTSPQFGRKGVDDGNHSVSFIQNLTRLHDIDVSRIHWLCAGIRKGQRRGSDRYARNNVAYAGTDFGSAIRSAGYRHPDV